MEHRLAPIPMRVEHGQLAHDLGKAIRSQSAQFAEEHRTEDRQGQAAFAPERASARIVAFEAIITVDYEPRTAVERELVLRLASLLWRIRRATAIDLFRMQAEVQWTTPQLRAPPSRPAEQSANVIYGFGSTLARGCEGAAPGEDLDVEKLALGRTEEQDDATSLPARSRQLAQSFLGIAKLDGDAFARLGRYEARLWRQFAQTVLGLQSVRRRAGPKWMNRLASE